MDAILGQTPRELSRNWPPIDRVHLLVMSGFDAAAIELANQHEIEPPLTSLFLLDRPRFRETLRGVEAESREGVLVRAAITLGRTKGPATAIQFVQDSAKSESDLILALVATALAKDGDDSAAREVLKDGLGEYEQVADFLVGRYADRISDSEWAEVDTDFVLWARSNHEPFTRAWIGLRCARIESARGHRTRAAEICRAVDNIVDQLNAPTDRLLAVLAREHARAGSLDRGLKLLAGFRKQPRVYVLIAAEMGRAMRPGVRLDDNCDKLARVAILAGRSARCTHSVHAFDGNEEALVRCQKVVKYRGRVGKLRVSDAEILGTCQVADIVTASLASTSEEQTALSLLLTGNDSLPEESLAKWLEANDIRTRAAAFRRLPAGSRKLLQRLDSEPTNVERLDGRIAALLLGQGRTGDRVLTQSSLKAVRRGTLPSAVTDDDSFLLSVLAKEIHAAGLVAPSAIIESALSRNQYFMQRYAASMGTHLANAPAIVDAIRNLEKHPASPELKRRLRILLARLDR